MRKSIIAALVGVLIVSLSVPASTVAGSETCDERLDRIREYLDENKATMTVVDGLMYVGQHAPSVCDFTSPPPTTSSVPNIRDLPAITELAEAADLDPGTTATVEPCTLPGAGPGTIAGTVLGVPLLTEKGAGEWYGVGANAVEVSGDGGTSGGTQPDGATGAVRFIHAVTLASEGSARATCLKTVSVTTTPIQNCWAVWVVIVFVTKCETRIDTQTDVRWEACSGSAHQLAGLDTGQVAIVLAELDHTYDVDPNPCKGV